MEPRGNCELWIAPQKPPATASLKQAIEPQTTQMGANISRRGLYLRYLRFITQIGPRFQVILGNALAMEVALRPSAFIRTRYQVQETHAAHVVTFRVLPCEPLKVAFAKMDEVQLRE